MLKVVFATLNKLVLSVPSMPVLLNVTPTTNSAPNLRTTSAGKLFTNPPSYKCILSTSTPSKNIGAEQLAKIKPSAILINVARGGIVNEAALAEALNNNALRGAALDVFTSEPLRESPLYHLKDPYRLLASPHNAWSPVEAIDRLIGCVERNIADYVAAK